MRISKKKILNKKEETEDINELVDSNGTLNDGDEIEGGTEIKVSKGSTGEDYVSNSLDSKGGYLGRSYGMYGSRGMYEVSKAKLINLIEENEYVDYNTNKIDDLEELPKNIVNTINKLVIQITNANLSDEKLELIYNSIYSKVKNGK